MGSHGAIGPGVDPADSGAWLDAKGNIKGKDAGARRLTAGRRSGRAGARAGHQRISRASSERSSSTMKSRMTGTSSRFWDKSS